MKFISKKSILVSLLFCLFISRSSFAGSPPTLHLHAPESGTIEDLSKQTKTPIIKDADSLIKIEAPTMIKLDGRIPVLIVPAQAGDTNVKLNPPFEKDVVERASQKDIGNAVSEIMMTMDTVHKNIQKKNYTQAANEIDDLQNRFPQVSYLGFARGSIYLLQGEKAKARQSVTRALESYPNYKEGQEFLKALGGEKTGGKDE